MTRFLSQLTPYLLEQLSADLLDEVGRRQIENSTLSEYISSIRFLHFHLKRRSSSVCSQISCKLVSIRHKFN